MCLKLSYKQTATWSSWNFNILFFPLSRFRLISKKRYLNWAAISAEFDGYSVYKENSFNIANQISFSIYLFYDAQVSQSFY